MASIIILSCIVVQTAIALYLFNTLKLKDDFEKLLNAILIILIFHLGSKFYILIVLRDSFLYNNSVTGFSFSYGPLLFLAARSLIQRPAKPKTMLLHLLPFLIFTVAYIINSAGYLLNLIPKGFVMFYKPVYHWLAVTSLITYPVVTIRILSTNRNAVPGSQLKKRLSTNMSYILLNGTLAGVIWGFLHESGTLQHEFDPRLVPYIFLAAWPVLIVRFKMFAVISTDSQPIVHAIKTIPIDTLELEKQYKKSALDKDRLDQYETEVKKFMVKSKIYLETDISLEDLAERLHIPKHHLTQLLNERFGKNFYAFLNEYRIQEAIKKLENPDIDESILSLAFDCGFNSKSSFNNYFKKITGLTPSVYRKEHLLQQPVNS